jgi:hypothetical protein
MTVELESDEGASQRVAAYPLEKGSESFFSQYFMFVLLAPSSPEDIKAASLNSDTVLVSWLPPAWPNGEILTYTLYKQADRVSQGSQIYTALVYEPNCGALGGLSHRVHKVATAAFRRTFHHEGKIR